MNRDLSDACAGERLRKRLFAFGTLIGLIGIWLAVPSLLTGGKTEAPPFDQGGPERANDWAKAGLAAWIGVIRGDLWANAAFTGASFSLDQSAKLDAAAARQVAEVRAQTERALALAPINGTAWLLLALLPSSPPEAEQRIDTFLELSYFTAPYAPELAPRRLHAVAATNALADTDIEPFIKADLQEILNHRSDAESIILSAYRKARVQNQAILASLVAEIDPQLAQRLNLGESK